MPTTRKKVIKTVYKDDDDSEAENAAGDFSDSGSEAEIPEQSSSEDEIEAADASADEFDEKITEKRKKLSRSKQSRPKFAKNFVSKINKQLRAGIEDDVDIAPALFSVKDLTDEDKLLPSVLNLSESDSSDDETPKVPSKKPTPAPSSSLQAKESESETEECVEYKDVWSTNLKENSEEIAKKTFMELEQHKTKLEETKASILKYREAHPVEEGSSDITDLLAQGEEVLPLKVTEKKGKKIRRARDDSDSEIEDWEEVKEAKSIPQQGLQLVVDFPEAGCRKKKTIDIEMMMKRKINRVKKEYQIYMHKVHVLCWLGHGNYVSRVLNDQDILAAALCLVPSKECYPGERVDMKYVEQITSWYKDKLTLKQDKNEDKFRPKAPPLKQILLGQIKKRVVTSKKYLVFIFVSMLRAIGLQCRVMFNFVTLPIKPPSSELCSLSTKTKDEKKATDKSGTEKSKGGTKAKKSKLNIPQVDGTDDGEFDDQNIMQLDGNDDTLLVKTRSTRANRKSNVVTTKDTDDVSPPKRARKSPSPRGTKTNPKPEASTKEDTIKMDKEEPKRKRVSKVREDECVKETQNTKKDKEVDKISLKTSRTRQQKIEKMEVDNLEVENLKPCKTRSSNKKTAKPTSSTVKKSKDQMDSSEKMDTKSKQNTHTNVTNKDKMAIDTQLDVPTTNPRKSRTTGRNSAQSKQSTSRTDQKLNVPNIIVTNENNDNLASKYFQSEKRTKRLSLNRNRSQTSTPSTSEPKPKSRTKSAPETSLETSKYFSDTMDEQSVPRRTKITKLTKKEMAQEDKQRVSHRDLAKKQGKGKIDVTGDLVDIIKKRVREAKEDTKKGKVKAKIKQESEDDSDHLPEEEPKRRNSDSDEDFKPTKISPKASTSKKIDRRVLSSDTDDVPTNTNKCDVWCEVYVEELEQWVAVDVIKAKVHCTNEIYNRASHPVCYVVGWDNNNYLKDLTRRYVPHWNTVTRKQRAEPPWWDKAIIPWLGPRTPRDREEDEQLNRMQLEAPLPKSIAEYKNHPLYALKRHLLKFEAIYPPDAATLGFVRGEPVYARDCVYVCRSRDVWLKEAKVVRLGEQPYKIVKARPKWDRLSNKLITDKPLEVFGPWQTQDYEPPVAENGVVPRNAYGNVELFKDCMLPKGTVHIKLPGLNRVAKKLNIDCAPAMTGFDFNGGWSHPVYDGFVVCKEFEQVITEAWLKDQEDQERKEREKIEARVYGNWRRLIKGLFIRERLKSKYGFEEPAPPPDKKKRGPKLVVKKRS